MVPWTTVFKKVDLIQHLFAKRCVRSVSVELDGLKQAFLLGGKHLKCGL